VPGISNGLAVMRDEESLSLWDHITGECFDGPLAGERMNFWPVVLTTVEAELAKYPDVILLQSNYRSLQSGVMRVVLGKSFINREGTKLLPHFRKSMHAEIDPRRPEGEQGLGVLGDNDQGKYYPMQAIPKGGVIEDVWNGRKLRIERNALDGVPFARWIDSNEPPMQLLTRWYGFSFTYPNCEIYGE
jgi:hypothetical protein